MSTCPSRCQTSRRLATRLSGTVSGSEVAAVVVAVGDAVGDAAVDYYFAAEGESHGDHDRLRVAAYSSAVVAGADGEDDASSPLDDAGETLLKFLL